MEIVGVVEDAKYENLRDEVPRQVFVAHQQSEWASGMTAYARTSMGSEAMFEAIRREVQRLDATMPIFDMSTMEDQLDRSLAVERITAFLSGAFGLLAAILAFVGLYGVTAYGVTRRSAELGLRIALGATGREVTTLVLKEVAWLSALGVTIALVCTWFVGELVESQLYGVVPRDPVTMALATASLVAITILAGAVPALRASRLDPVSVLRYE
jgi:ABC-type antimicrobial peptide transport system permease subunit